jgi:membrane protein
MHLGQKRDGPRTGLIRTGVIRPGRRDVDRPEPEEAPLANENGGPAPQPERREPSVPDPGLRDLTFADWQAIVKRAVKEFMGDNAMMLASALAYSSFFAIPAVLIVATGLFTLVAGPGTIEHLMQQLHGVMPAQATSLLGDSLRRADANPGSSILMTVLGFVLAVWAVTGAMNSYMLALNLAYDRQDRRSFVQKRVVALKMAAVMGVSFLLVAVLTIFGPVVERAIATRIGPAGDVVSILWWIVQWPILLAGLLVAFATLLYLGPDVDHRRWQFLTPGSFVAALLWIAASGLFAVYTATFASYNKTWGALSAVIVMLTWLWITGMALLLGAEINSETERSRKLRSARDV